MKTSHVVVAGILAGLALGGGLSYARFAPPVPFVVKSAAPPAPRSGDFPRAKVDHDFWDFGLVDRDADVRHSFSITNIGTSPLTLKDAGTTCTKCTIAELARPELAPGETAEVTVVYHTNVYQPNFTQTAFIKTNDPDKQRIELRIAGVVSTRFSVVPDVITLGKIASAETQTTNVKIWSFVSKKIDVVAHEFTVVDTATFFAVASRPLAEDEVTEHRAKSGCQLVLTVKPGLPLGPIRQTIRVTLALEGADDRPTVDIPIGGVVDSDISVVGAHWDAEHSRLAMGIVKASSGATRTLLLLARGEHCDDITFRVATVEPEWLKVSLGDRSDLKSGAVSQTRLTIEIPKDAPLGSHRGNDQGKYAEIVLESNHPDVKQIHLFIQFAVVP